MAGVPIRIDIIARDMASRVIENTMKPIRAFGTTAVKAGKLVATAIGKPARKAFDTVRKSVDKTALMFRKFVSRVANAAQALTKFVGKSKATQAAANKLSGSLKGLLGVAAGYLALRTMVRGALASAAAFNTQEAAVRGLQKALELNGEFTEATMEAHKQFASQMQRDVNVGDEVVLSMMKQASMLGINDDQLQNVTKTAIGLAEATGIDLQTAMKRTVGALSGVYGELGELIPAVRNATSDEEKLAAITDLAAKGLAQKQSAAERLSGAMTRAGNTFGDLAEKVGELLSPILTVALDGFVYLAEIAMQSVDNMITAAGGLDRIKVVAQAFVMNIVERFVFMHTLLETIMFNIPEIVQIAVLKAKLFIIGFVEDVKHFFTVKLPAYFVWFAENFFKIIRDAFMAVITVVKNAMLITGRIITESIEFIMSGFEGGFANISERIGRAFGDGLLDGFEATTDALPDIADRALTATELQMQGRVNDMSNSLSQEFEDKFNARMAAIKNKAEQGDVDLEKLAKSGGAGGKDAGSAATAFESRLQTRGQSSITMMDVMQKIERNTNETKQYAEQLVENTSPTDGEDETEISFEIVNGGQ